MNVTHASVDAVTSRQSAALTRMSSGFISDRLMSPTSTSPFRLSDAASFEASGPVAPAGTEPAAPLS